MEGFTVGYQPGSSVAPDCRGRLAVPEGLVSQVAIDADGEPHRDPAAEARVGLTRQQGSRHRSYPSRGSESPESRP